MPEQQQNQDPENAPLTPEEEQAWEAQGQRMERTYGTTEPDQGT